jgi:TrmH family RNA methyltransferase
MTSPAAITSTRNQHVAFCRLLHKPTSRREARALLVEGVRMAEEALDSRWSVLVGLYDPTALDRSQAGKEMARRLREIDHIHEATAAVLKAAAETVHPAGVVLALEQPREPDLNEIAGNDLVLVLDGISDPGNAGTIIRSAAAAGLRHVVFAGSCVDAFDAKVVRAGAGAHFRLAVHDASWTGLAPVLRSFPQVIGADAAGPAIMYEIDWSMPTALIIGSEAHGLSRDARSIVTTLARVPMANDVESLNAAMVASIMLFQPRSPKCGR